MLIQTLPPRLMWRVMAIRADSICRFVTYAGSRAWMPYSPNVTRVPPLAAPLRLGRCCLRCLTRRGMSIGSPLLSVVGRRLRGLLGLAHRGLDRGRLRLSLVRTGLRVRRVSGSGDSALRLATRSAAGTAGAATGRTRAGVAARLAGSLCGGLALGREARHVG